MTKIIKTMMIVCFVACAGFASETLDLSGTWRFQLDRNDEGISSQWFSRTLGDSLQLPGSIQEQGFGDEIGKDTKWALSRPESYYWDPILRKEGVYSLKRWAKARKYYIGSAWFQKEFDVPADWGDKRVDLQLERVMWKSQVWVDGRDIGVCDNVFVPHRYELGNLTPGKHTVTVMVDNRMQAPIGAIGHVYTDHTQSIWLGIIGAIELTAENAVTIDDVQVYGDAAERTARVAVKLVNASAPAGKGILTAVAIQNGKRVEKEVPIYWTARGGTAEFELDLGSKAKLWDEFSPNLFTLNIALKSSERMGDEKQTTFGLRDFGLDGTVFTINGRKIMLRGTLDCCVFPLTGYPSMDVAEWKRIFEVSKAHGLNHFRFHSWCPPRAAFVAADEVGFYLHPEYVWSSLFEEDAQMFVENESERVLREYGNHPSFCMMGVGNELNGSAEWMSQLIQNWKRVDNRHVYSGLANGWLGSEDRKRVPVDPAVVPEYDFYSGKSVQGVAFRGQARIKDLEAETRFGSKPPSTMDDYKLAVAGYDHPLISHEAGQRCSFPALETQIEKYKKGSFRITNLEVGLERMKQSGLLELNDDFVQASGKWQALIYKEETEGFLRTKGFGGFQLLGLNDFPGQGCALVGILDAFWDPKGYISAEEYHRFSGATVPLARLPKLVWTEDETLSGTFEIANFGPAPIKKAVPYWKITDADGRVLLEKELRAVTIPVDNGIALGDFRLAASKLPGMGKYRLVLGLKGLPYENDWEFWVYPETVSSEPANVTVATELDEAALKVLENGGRVLLLADQDLIAKGRFAKSGLLTPYWVPGLKKPETLGMLTDPKHPAFTEFPTDEYSNWQWWELFVSMRAPVLEPLGKEFTPIIRMIDDWNQSRSLGVLFEGLFGGGKLMVTTLDLSSDLKNRVVARQLRHSILSYMGSDAFDPQQVIPADALGQIFPSLNVSSSSKITAAPDSSPVSRTSLALASSTTVPMKATADCFESRNPPEHAIDGDLKTMWHTPWVKGEAVPYPHFLIVELSEPAIMKGISVLPRQGNPPNGLIGDYSIYLSDDGKTWGVPVAEGKWTGEQNLKTVSFSPKKARFLKLVAESPVRKAHRYASVAELKIVFGEE